MGLLERVRALLGRETHRPAVPPTEIQDAQPPTEGTPTQQSHGSHWDTVVGDELSPGVQELLMETVQSGERTAGAADGVEAYRLGDGPLATRVVTRNGEIVTGYPVVEGVSHEFHPESVETWENGLEAWVGGRVRDVSITGFGTNVFETTATGGTTAEISLLAYDFGPSEYDTVGGGERDVSEFVGFRPLERGAPDDVVVRTEIREVERVSHLGYDGYHLRVPLFEADGEQFDAGLFVGDHVAGDYEPAVGDTVEGAWWCQLRIE